MNANKAIRHVCTCLKVSAFISLFLIFFFFLFAEWAVTCRKSPSVLKQKQLIFRPPHSLSAKIRSSQSARVSCSEMVTDWLVYQLISSTKKNNRRSFGIGSAPVTLSAEVIKKLRNECSSVFLFSTFLKSIKSFSCIICKAGERFKHFR